MAKERTMATQRIILSTPDELRARIRAYRFDRKINTEAEAIRELIEKGLEASGFSATRQPKPGIK